MARSLAGQVALITGASSGIGWELGRQLALQGCPVGLVARREQPLRELQQIITQAGGTSAVAVADVAERHQIENAVQQIREQLGPVDLVFANAGVGKTTQIHPVNVAEVEQVIRTNLLGVIYTLSAALPEMLTRGTGRLIGISSLAGYRGLPGESAYCASKAAVNSYLDGLRIQLRDSGVRVTTICPGFITTPMTANMNFHLPGLMTAEKAVQRMIRAVKAGTKVYSFPWHVHMMVKFSRWMPDRVMARIMRDKAMAPNPVTPPSPT